MVAFALGKVFKRTMAVIFSSILVLGIKAVFVATVLTTSIHYWQWHWGIVEISTDGHYLGLSFRFLGIFSFMPK